MNKWVLANLMRGGGGGGGRVTHHGLASHSGWSRNTPDCFMLQNRELSADLMGHLACVQTLP